MRVVATVGVAAGLVIGVGFTQLTAASAAQPPVGLGTAASFAVLAGSTVTNTGPTVVSGDVGVSPGSAITGFPPGLVTNGTVHVADGVAAQAQSDLATAYNDAAGRTPATPVSSDLGGQTLDPGIYQSASGMSLTGTVTLNGNNDPSAVFIFQAGSTLITASNSSVNLINGAQACNVFWQVGSSATLGTSTAFVGSILALTSASVDTGSTVTGRVLARNGAVTLDDNVIDVPACTAATTSTTSTGSTSTGSTSTPSAGTSSAGTSAGTTSTGSTSAPTASPTATTPSPPSAAAPSSTSTVGLAGGGTGAAGVSASTPSIVAGATTVHTGKFWAGSGPYLEAAATVGGGLVVVGVRRRRRASRA